MVQSFPLQRISNFRDVGKTVNQFLGHRRIREGVLYRSAGLDEATSEDKRMIREELGIKTIIDLRTKTESIKQSEKRKARLNLATPRGTARQQESHHIAGLDYQEIKIPGRPFERHVLSQLSLSAFFKVIALFVLGRRIDALRVVSRQIILPRGLIGLGLDTLDHSGTEICRALSIYTTSQSLPSIVHCTQGKDRTGKKAPLVPRTSSASPIGLAIPCLHSQEAGLICALILMILGVSRSAIEHDYFLTDAAHFPNRYEMLVEMRDLGLTEDWASTSKDLIVAIEKHLEDKYGGLENYLDQIGFGPIQRAQVKETLSYQAN